MRHMYLVAAVCLLIGGGIALAVPAAANSPRLRQLVWKDVTGAQVDVVAVDILPNRYQVLDSQGQLWQLDYQEGSVTPISPGNTTVIFYESSDCTGTPYIPLIASRSTVAIGARPNDVRIVPNDVAFKKIAPGSLLQVDGVPCASIPALPMRAIRFDTLPRAKAVGRIGTPPFHPETVEVD